MAPWLQKLVRARSRSSNSSGGSVADAPNSGNSGAATTATATNRVHTTNTTPPTFQLGDRVLWTTTNEPYPIPCLITSHPFGFHAVAVGTSLSPTRYKYSIIFHHYFQLSREVVEEGELTLAGPNDLGPFPAMPANVR